MTVFVDLNCQSSANDFHVNPIPCILDHDRSTTICITSAWHSFRSLDGLLNLSCNGQYLRAAFDYIHLARSVQRCAERTREASPSPCPELLQGRSIVAKDARTSAFYGRTALLLNPVFHRRSMIGTRADSQMRSPWLEGAGGR